MARSFSMLSALLLAVLAACYADDTHTIPVIEREGRAFVSASALTKLAEFAVKTLPPQNRIVVCARDRCAAVKDALREGDDTLLAVAAVADALGATAAFDGARQHVEFRFDSKSRPADAVARVGQLAPDFRLAKLDGSPVALSDFRGKRVLINSWASW